MNDLKETLKKLYDLKDSGHSLSCDLYSDGVFELVLDDWLVFTIDDEDNLEYGYINGKEEYLRVCYYVFKSLLPVA